MPSIVLPSQKRALAEASDALQNVLPSAAPLSAKRRKLDLNTTLSAGSLKVPGGRSRPQGSNAPKSQFEEEVLEKLTQDMSQLKHKNSERDQQWERPSLANFDAHRDTLLFQQIEAEKGYFSGGRPSIRLFGVTEVWTRSRKRSLPN